MSMSMSLMEGPEVVAMESSGSGVGLRPEEDGVFSSERLSGERSPSSVRFEAAGCPVSTAKAGSCEGWTRKGIGLKSGVVDPAGTVESDSDPPSEDGEDADDIGPTPG